MKKIINTTYAFVTLALSGIAYLAYTTFPGTPLGNMYNKEQLDLLASESTKVYRIVRVKDRYEIESEGIDGTYWNKSYSSGPFSTNSYSSLEKAESKIQGRKDRDARWAARYERENAVPTKEIIKTYN